MTTERHRRIGRVRDRVAALEKQAGLDTPGDVLAVTDDHGHVLWPEGKPRRGATVTEVHIGGLNIERDI